MRGVSHSRLGNNETSVRDLQGAIQLSADDLNYAVVLSIAKEHGSPVGMLFQTAVPKGSVGAKVTQEFFGILSGQLVSPRRIIQSMFLTQMVPNNANPSR